jgi:hypothetical protein
VRVAIVAPIFISQLRHEELCNETTNSINSFNHELVWIPVINHLKTTPGFDLNHFSQQPSQIHILEGRQPQSVSKAWNDGFAKAKEVGCDYIFIINTDIVLHPDTIDNLVEFAELHPEAIMWSARDVKNPVNLKNPMVPVNTLDEDINYSAFMLKKNFQDQIGTFDENFQKAYWEDIDIHLRMILAGKKGFKCNSSLFYHYGSQTIQNDREVEQQTNYFWTQNQQYFIKKWGCARRDNEKYDYILRWGFKYPYNEKDKPLSYWRLTP